LDAFALWDVLHMCRRIGSADSAIDPKSLVVNDFAELFANYPAVTRVYFNGGKAAELYRRLADTAERAEYRQLPSTSPAHVCGRAPDRSGSHDTGGRR
jgi:hypoxanthine-DNA glycosylase